MALHIGFNNSLSRIPGMFGIIAAIVIGLAGIGLVTGFIFWGLRQERRWMKETLGLSVGVSARESAVVQQMADLDILLAPVGERFGTEKRKKVEAFLKLQAQLGIRRKQQNMTQNAGQKQELADKIAALQKEIDALRREAGVYCMTYVRSILPPETEPIWSHLAGSLEVKETDQKGGLWKTIGEKMGKERGRE
jgi:hypothetical protein